MEEKYTIVQDGNTTYAYIEIENITEKTLYLLNLLQENCTIQKYYWRSLYDNNHIEYLEPKIYDAFYMCIDVSGWKFDIEECMLQYTKHKGEREYLHRCLQNSLSENEIKDLALKFMFTLK